MKRFPTGIASLFCLFKKSIYNPCQIKVILKQEGHMKKLLLIVIISVMVVGCASSKRDKYERYRNMSAEQIYDFSQKALANNHSKDAVSSLEALDMLYPFGDYSRQGKLDMIYAYYQADDKASALASADRYIRLYPRGQDTDYAYYMKGVVDYEMSDSWLRNKFNIDGSQVDLATKKDAFLAFSDLISYYPNSTYSNDAKLRMESIRNMAARQNVDIAKFYYRRKAYIASANRAAFVVQHFEGSPQVIPALAIMIKSYREMGLHDMEDKTLRILQSSYPNSKELRDIKSRTV